MQNKMTPPKSLRSYLDILHANCNADQIMIERKRKSIFSHERTPSAKKSHNRSQQQTTIGKSITYVHTETIDDRSTEDLVKEMTELLNTIKVKYNVYVKAQQQNGHLKKQNAFLKQQLTRLRGLVAQSNPQNLEEFKSKNQILHERLKKAKNQLNELRRIYVKTDIVEDLDRIVDILHD